jgi:uncharacterized membrane protein YfcA
MLLAPYEILLLLAIGVLVGISMSFIGQTGQALVIPAVLLITGGNVLLAVTVNLLNDLLAAVSVSTAYVRHHQYVFHKKLPLFLVIALALSLCGVFLVTTTTIGSNLGWFLPIIFLIIGIFVLRRGFPTSESLRITVLNMAKNIAKRSGDQAELLDLEEKIRLEKLSTDAPIESEIKGVIPESSKVFYIILSCFAVGIGLNSGLTGANSGILFSLFMILVMGYPLKKGVGTALLLSIAMCVFTFTAYQVLGIAIEGHVFFNVEITLLLALGSVPSGFITSHYIQRLSAKRMGRGMAIIMILLSTITLVIFFTR